jgi:hydrogenase maturation protease
MRTDDGIGPWLAAWADERFGAEPAVRVISRHQWTPDLAEDIARAESVVFVDCAIDSEPGKVRLMPVESRAADAGLATHHVGAQELLALGQELYGSLPRNALLLTIGAGSTQMGETFSENVNDALPEACGLLESTVQRLLTSGDSTQRA